MTEKKDFVGIFQQVHYYMKQSENEIEHLRNRMLKKYQESLKKILRQNALYREKLAASNISFGKVFYKVRKMSYSFFTTIN